MIDRTPYIMGIHPVLETLLSGKEVDKVLIKKGITGDGVREILDILRKTGTPYQFVPIEKLNRISRKNHQGIIAFTSLVSYAPVHEIVQRAFEKGEIPLILALDGVTDVRNLGAIARSAEVVGAHGLLFPDKGMAQINPETMKSSAGAMNLINISRTSNLADSLKELKNAGLRIVGADEKSDKRHYEADLKNPLVLVMGSEEKGLSREVQAICDEMISIPQHGRIQSLNVSAAAAVLLFEIERQRNT